MVMSGRTAKQDHKAKSEDEKSKVTQCRVARLDRQILLSKMLHRVDPDPEQWGKRAGREKSKLKVPVGHSLVV